MNLKCIYFGFYLCAVTTSWAQTIKTSIIFNNSFDKDKFEKVGILTAIQNSVSSAEFNSALLQNYSLTDKNLKIDFVFFDRGQISRYKLKDPHSCVPQEYSQIWMNRDSNSNRILFLFVKDFRSGNYRFDRLELSKRLIREHLDEIVLDFIREHLSGDFVDLVNKGCRYLSRAIRPVWTQQKMDLAKSLVSESRYFKGHCVSGEFDLRWYDFKPVHLYETVISENNYEVYDKNDSLKDSHFINLPSESVNSLVELRNEETGLDGIQSWQTDWAVDMNKQQAIVKDEFLSQFVRQINGCKMYDPVRKASEWNWEEGTNGYRLVVDNGFLPRNSNNILEMFLARSEVGSAFPVISPYRKLTWCNVFARDLASDVLFGYIPWSSNECANRLHYRIIHDRENFRELDLKKAWDLTKKGFIVYLSSFNSSMDPGVYLGKSSEKEVPASPSGHIATCFPEDNKVVQAGIETNIIDINRVWSITYSQSHDKVKASIFLGNLLK